MCVFSAGHEKLTHKADRQSTQKERKTNDGDGEADNIFSLQQQFFVCFFSRLFGGSCYGLGRYAYTITNVHEKLCAAKTAVIHT